MHAEVAARSRRRRILISVAVGLALVLSVGVGVVVQGARVGGTGDGGSAPSGVTGDGYVIGSADAEVTIAVYEDFQCPSCAAFEAASGATLRALADSGRARVRYYPIAFLDRYSTDRYSTRALNAGACVLDLAPEGFPNFHDRLLASQPVESGPGIPDAQLVQRGVDAGTPRDQMAACVRDLAFEEWTRTVTDASSKAGVIQTPTVLVAGNLLVDLTPRGLRAAVRAATRG